MEVHHHPEVEKKGFKEYLLEGLMIFVAVTMGFFAESLRENMNDSRLEKEYAKTLYIELRDDSVTATVKLQMRRAKNNDLDYLYVYFKDSSLTTLPKRFYPAYTNGFYLINRFQFEPKDGILSQLRNSGSMRYFKSVPLQKYLGDLSVAINNMRYRNEEEYQYFASPLKAFLLEHFDFGWLNQLRSTDVPENIDTVFKRYMNGKRVIPGEILNPQTLNRGTTANMAYCYKQLIVSTNSLQLNAYIVANKQILAILRKTYHLDNE